MVDSLDILHGEFMQTQGAQTSVTGKEIKIAESKSPAFKAGKALKDALN